MDQSKKKKYMFIAGPLVIFIALIGLTYAFFNYTRTGQANNLGTGRIYFNTSEGNAINLTNMFPMTAAEADEASIDSITVGITGDTTYTDGEEFAITLADVNNTVNGKHVPVSYIATYTAATGGTIGESSDTYFTSRESKDATIYKLNTTGLVEDGKQVLVGYIDNGATGISGTLTIKAFIDANKIAISDTYPNGPIYEVPDNLTSDQLSACMSLFDSFNPTEAFCRGTGTITGPSGSPTTLIGLIESGLFGEAYIEYLLQTGIIHVVGENGTTDNWVNDRAVFTTSEWNSLGSTPISFEIRAESNEGIWTTTQIDSCVGCKFLYHSSDLDDPSTMLFTTWAIDVDQNNNVVPVTPSTLTTGVYDNYLDLINDTGKSYFIGVKLNSSNQATNAYACGVKENIPYCIEGSLYGAFGGTEAQANYGKNRTVLRMTGQFNNSCTILIEHRIYEPQIISTNCESSLYKVKIADYGAVGVGYDTSGCFVNINGAFGCASGMFTNGD